VSSRYDYKEAISLVHKLILKYDIAATCCVSSFNHDLLAELEELSRIHGAASPVESIYLYNYYDNDELPHPDIFSNRGKGINISSTKLTKEVV